MSCFSLKAETMSKSFRKDDAAAPAHPKKEALHQGR